MTPPTKQLPQLRYPGTAAAMLAAATSQIGVHEGRDSSGWNNDNPYGLWMRMNGVAWCAIFVSWSAAHSGCQKIVPRGAWTPSMAQWFKDRDQWQHNPRPGDLFFKYGYVPRERRSRIHHVGLVIKPLGDGYFLTVEGNTNNSGSAQGDGVYKLKRHKDNLGSGGGFGRPKYKSIVRTVSLKFHQQYARQNGKYGWVVGTALKKETGGNTVKDYAEYQRSLGYKGRDADGIAGEDSLTKLGKKYGFRVRP